jgi:hypothetical protein
MTDDDEIVQGIRRHLATSDGLVPAEPPGGLDLRLPVTGRATPARGLSSIGSALAIVAVVVLVGALVASRAASSPVAVGPSQPVPTAALITPGPTKTPTAPSLVWSSPSEVPDAVSIAHVIAGSRGYLAVGSGSSPNGAPPSAAVWSSADGVTWSRVASSASFADAEISRVVETSNGIVAFGIKADRQGQCQTTDPKCLDHPSPIVLWDSPDGQTWARIPTPSAFDRGEVRDVAATPFGIVAVGDVNYTRAAAWISSDGLTWTSLNAISSQFGDATFEGVATLKGRVVIVGRTGGNHNVPGGVNDPGRSRPAAWWSTDGVHWNVSDVQGFTQTGAELSSVTAGSSSLLAIGKDPVVDPQIGPSLPILWRSDDGTAWREVGPLGSTVPAGTLASAGGGFVFLGPSPDASGGSVDLIGSISADGMNWRRLPFTGAIQSLPIAVADGVRPTISTMASGPSGVVVFGSGGPPVSVWMVTLANP